MNNCFKSFRAKLILLTALACLLVGIFLLWPGENSSLDFIGYRLNATNHIWYAELSFVNRSRKAIKYDIADNAQTTFFYQFKQTNELKEGWFGPDARLTERTLEPNQRVTFLAPLDLTREMLADINRKIESLADIETLHVAAGSSLRIGVFWPANVSSQSILQDGIYKIEKALNMKPTAKSGLEPQIIWCPELLSPPRKAKP